MVPFLYAVLLLRFPNLQLFLSTFFSPTGILACLNFSTNTTYHLSLETLVGGASAARKLCDV
ncbi:hypothetical protein EK904_008435 [Melospiza melodia maxima]|nr:hypothetical protein EK904_008435 [Melospiza melodia maxima]